MAKNRKDKVTPDMEDVVMSYLIRTALDRVDKNRLCNLVSSLEIGKIAYLLNVPMFKPMINTFIIIKNTREIGKVIGVNTLNSTCTIACCSIETKYFKTAEMAERYASTGEKGKYEDWEYSSDEDHKHKGEYKSRLVGDCQFTEIEPLNAPEKEFEDEIKMIESE